MTRMLIACLTFLAVGVWLLSEAQTRTGDSMAVAGWIVIVAGFVCLVEAAKEHP